MGDVAGTWRTRTLWNLAYAAYERGDMPAARQRCDQLLNDHPKTGSVLFLRGLCRVELGEQEEALSDMSESAWLTNDEELQRIILEKSAQLRMRMEDYAGAVCDCDRSLAVCPDEPSVWVKRGMALFQLELFDEAFEDFGRAIAADPDYAKGYFWRGWAAYLAGYDLEAVIADLKRATELEPMAVNAHFVLGQATQDAGQLFAAASHYRRSIQLAPSDWCYTEEASANLASTLTQLRRDSVTSS